MAKVIITIEDKPETHSIKLSCESDPVFNQKGVENTYAQEIALMIVAEVADFSIEDGNLNSAKVVHDDGSEEDIYV